MNALWLVNKYKNLEQFEGLRHNRVFFWIYGLLLVNYHYLKATTIEMLSLSLSALMLSVLV